MSTTVLPPVKMLGKMFWPAYMMTGTSNCSCWIGRNTVGTGEDVDSVELLDDAELSMYAGLSLSSGTVSVRS